MKEEGRMGVFKANIVGGQSRYILAETLAKAAEIADESVGRDGPAISSVEMVAYRFLVSSSISLSVEA